MANISPNKLIPEESEEQKNSKEDPNKNKLAVPTTFIKKNNQSKSKLVGQELQESHTRIKPDLAGEAEKAISERFKMENLFAPERASNADMMMWYDFE